MRLYKPAAITLSGIVFALGLLTLAAPAHAAGLPQLDISRFPPQIIWLVVSFVVLYVIMAKTALPRVGQILEERHQRIEDNLKKAELLKGDAEAAAQAYEKSLTDSRAKAQNLLREAREQAAQEAASRQSELGERLGKQVSAAEANIADAKNKALGEVHSIATDVAAAVASRLIGETLSSKDAEPAVAAVIKERK